MYLFIILIFISCSKEDNSKELPSTTEITCFFAYNNSLSESKNTAIYQTSQYNSYYSFSNKINKITITCKNNSAKAEIVTNTIIIDPSKPNINDGITLHGLYTGNNTITVKIRSIRRVYSKLYTPNSLGELILKDSDIIPIYNMQVKENVFISPDCNLYLGVFTPYNSAAKFIFSKNTDDNIQYKYRFINETSKRQIEFYEKNGIRTRLGYIVLSEEIKRGGVIINEAELSEVKIECKSKKPEDFSYNLIGVKTFKLVPGECIVKRFTEVDFISE